MTMVSKLLAVRRSLRGTEWDGTYLDHFVQVISRLDARQHGFGAADLGAIAARASKDEAAWSGGFVAKLRDGRRGHVHGDASVALWGGDAHIQVASLDGDVSRPETERRHGPEDHAWDEDLAHRLNEFLSRVTSPPTG